MNTNDFPPGFTGDQQARREATHGQIRLHLFPFANSRLFAFIRGFNRVVRAEGKTT